MDIRKRIMELLEQKQKEKERLKESIKQQIDNYKPMQEISSLKSLQVLCIEINCLEQAQREPKDEVQTVMIEQEKRVIHEGPA